MTNLARQTMNRLKTCLLCIGVFFLSGCPNPAPLVSQTAVHVLEPAYVETFEETAMPPKWLEFSGKGDAFLVAGGADYIYLYNSTTFKKSAATAKKRTIMEKKSKVFLDWLSVAGVGYIDDNTWYFAEIGLTRDEVGRNAAVHIWQVDPPRELHKHAWGGVDWRGFSSSPVLANATHVAHGRRLLNWHDGSTYEVILEHPGRFGYGLTPDSRVVTSNYDGDVYLFYDPVTKNGTVWDVGAARSSIQNRYSPIGMKSGSLILSPDAQYGLVTSNQGKCELWQLQLPQKELAGRCGRNSLFSGKRWHRVAFTRDSRAFALAAENEVFVYTTQPFRQVLATTLAHKVQALALEADRLSVADESGAIFVWDTATGKLLGEYRPNINTEEDADNQTTHLLDLQPGGRKLLAAQRYRFMVFDLPVAPRGFSAP